MNQLKLLQYSLYFVGIVQLFFGLFFLLAPSMAPIMFNLATPPEWVNWMFIFMSARFLGFAGGMFIAASDPVKYRSWILMMIGVQIIDWLGTVFYVAGGAVTLVQVSTASFLPLVFITLLVYAAPVWNKASTI